MQTRPASSTVAIPPPAALLVLFHPPEQHENTAIITVDCAGAIRNYPIQKAVEIIPQTDIHPVTIQAFEQYFKLQAIPNADENRPGRTDAVFANAVATLEHMNPDLYQAWVAGLLLIGKNEQGKLLFVKLPTAVNPIKPTLAMRDLVEKRAKCTKPNQGH